MPFPEGRLLRLPGELLLKLELHLAEFHRDIPFEDHLATLIANWLRDDRARIDVLEASACRRGYQWKDVFLVDRTLVKTIVRDHCFVAEVVNDDLVFDGAKTSPSRFANGFGTARRNAWDYLWVRRPGEQAWIRAKQLRGIAAEVCAISH